MEQGIFFLPFTISTLGWILTLILLLFASALISGSETAFFSLSPTKIAELENDKNRASEVIIRLLNNSEGLLSTLLITNNLVNIAAVLVANTIINQLVFFGNVPIAEYVVKTVALTFFLLLFGEIMPKLLANYKPQGFARLMAQPIWMLSRVLSPFSWILVKLGGSITSRMPSQGVSLGQLQDALEITHTDSAEDKRMLSGIARFSSTQAVEISIPRIDVVALEYNTPYSKVMELMVSTGFSRIPVYKEDFDHVEGILYIKDLLSYITQGDDFEWQKLLRKPYFVPEHKKIDDLLAEFQSRKNHMAIVVDEYGGTLGIATLEDVLEEIVGEITDESDAQNDHYEKISAGVFLFEGRTHIGDLLRVLARGQNFFDQQKGDADTIAGLMLEVKGDFVKPSEVMVIEGITFTAQEIEGRRITKVRVEVDPDSLN
ncbi:MAG: gliding motility-associated protein GldE [Rikenellaceae bacterium]